MKKAVKKTKIQLMPSLRSKPPKSVSRLLTLHEKLIVQIILNLCTSPKNLCYLRKVSRKLKNIIDTEQILWYAISPPFRTILSEITPEQEEKKSSKVKHQFHLSQLLQHFGKTKPNTDFKMIVKESALQRDDRMAQIIETEFLKFFINSYHKRKVNLKRFIQTFQPQIVFSINKNERKILLKQINLNFFENALSFSYQASFKLLLHSSDIKQFTISLRLTIPNKSAKHMQRPLYQWEAPKARSSSGLQTSLKILRNLPQIKLFTFDFQKNIMLGLQELEKKKTVGYQDYQVEFINFSFTYLDCVLGFVGTDVAHSINKIPLQDDLDSQFGLHDYEISIELRSFAETYWNNKFIGVFTKTLDGGFAIFDLISSDEQSGVYSTTHYLKKEIAFKWTGFILGSAVKDIAVLDVEIVDEFKGVFHSESEIIQLSDKNIFGNQLSYDHMDSGKKFSIIGGSKDVIVEMELREVQDREEIQICDLRVRVKLSKINAHFHTSYP